MSEKSLEQLLDEMRSERIACERVLVSVHALAQGELKEILGTVLEQAALKSDRITQAEIPANFKETVSSSIVAAAAVCSRLSESTSLLEEQTTRICRVQRRCSLLTKLSLVLFFSCCFFIGLTAYSYWYIHSVTTSMWFEKIFIENADTISQCLEPKILKQSQGRCTIHLPVQTK
jgi:hypothetical protein